MADLEPPVHIITIVASLKSRVAEARIEASKLNRLKSGDYISPCELQKDVENIYALLDANLNELEAAVDLVVTGNELLNLNSAKKLGLQSTQIQASWTSALSLIRPVSPLQTPQVRPPVHPHHQNSGLGASDEWKLAPAPDSNQMAQSEPSPNRYEKHIDDRDDVPTLELRQLGKNLAATIDALDSDVEQIQKAQVSGLAEAMTRRSTDTWDLEPKDSRDINKNAATVDS
ncbi:hypothetical protein FPRO06_13806 [Fusarium proliferatum]|nr:hypothetical protein FPRO06_13806 [Fusarium proliferatum]